MLIESPWRRGLLVGAAISALVCVLVVSASDSALMGDLELWGYDLLVNAGPQPAPQHDVVIVDFDDATISALHSFPVPRKTLAEVIRRVSAAGPDLIGLDFLLVERRSPVEDQELAEVISTAGNVVIASQFASDALPAEVPLPEYCEPDPASVPYCKSGAAMAEGVVNIPVDDDGFIRRAYLLPPKGTAALPFPVAIASLYRRKPLQRLRAGTYSLGTGEIALDETGRNTFRIGTWSSRPAMTISAIKVLSGAADLAMVKGKVVLVGQGSAAGKDLHFTPVFRVAQADRSRVMLSGVDIHAAAITSLLEGKTVRVIGRPALWAVIFLVGWIVAAFIVGLTPGFSVPVVLAAALALYGVAQGLLSWQHMWLRFVAGEAVVLSVLPAGLGYRFVTERLLKSRAEAERKQLMSIFARYVSPEVAAEIWERRGEIVLAGQEKIATVLFSDIRSFTRITAGKPSAEVLEWLNDYFTAMAAIVRDEGGFLNKFIGDGLMAVFGVPVSQGEKEDACRAVRAALRMIQEVERLNQLHAGNEKRPRLKIGVGIHTGMLTAGNVGSSDRLEYSVIGETVNLASRLESVTKEFKSEIVLSPQTHEQVQDRFPTRLLGETSIRGFEDTMQTIKVYGLADAPEAARGRLTPVSSKAAGGSQ